jgi:hypothetical protein
MSSQTFSPEGTVFIMERLICEPVGSPPAVSSRLAPALGYQRRQARGGFHAGRAIPQPKTA